MQVEGIICLGLGKRVKNMGFTFHTCFCQKNKKALSHVWIIP